MEEYYIQTHVMSGVDKSLIGLELGGWKFEIVEKPSADQKELRTQESMFYEKFTHTILIGPNLPTGYMTEPSNPHYIYARKNAEDPVDIRPVFDAIRLFKLSKIGCYYPQFFNEAGGCVTKVLTEYAFECKNKVDGLENFSLVEKEKGKLFVFYSKVINKQSVLITHMLELFHESYRSTNGNAAFILRVTIMEMLINGNAEMTYKLSRSVAVLLGKSRDKSLEIYKNCKKMYSARSTFLHDGNADKISEQYKLLAIDYSRRIIANLILIDEDIEDVRNMLDSCGFGDDPYHVEF